MKSDDNLIDITPPPMFARLVPGNDRVLRLMEVFCRMFVLGTVATADMTAGQARAEMDPAIAHLQALLATIGRRLDAGI